MTRKKSYFDRLRNKVAGKQDEIVSETLDTLYELSPHVGDPESPWAEGEYEINHKVSINGEDPGAHFPSLKIAANAREMIEHQSKSEEGVTLKPEFVEIVTGMSSTGKAFIAKEKLMASMKIRCGDRATISNDTYHALDVEYGPEVPGNFWEKDGYRPYSKTKKHIKAKYKNVLK